MRSRTWLTGLALAAGMGLAGATPAAADYPSDTIHLVVAYPAGGGTDAIARGLGSALEELVDVAVVVDNVTGGVGVTGSFHVVNARPDGHTLLMTGSSDLVSLLVFREPPFGLDDYAFVGGFYETPTWAVAHADRGYETLQDVLDAADERPGEITVGIGGRGGAHHVMAAAIIGASEREMRLVAYDGGAALRRALIADEVDFGIIHSPVMLGEIEDGMIRVLAAGGPLDNIVYEPVRDTALLRDFGIPVDIGITRGVFAPKDTPAEVLEQLGELIEQAAKSETFARFGENFGFAPIWLTGEEFEAVLRQEFDEYTDIKATYIDN